MCLKPPPLRPMPNDTGLVGAALFDFVGDVLYAQVADGEFADLYPNNRQPSIMPVILSFVTSFQYFEDLSDRDTSLALKFAASHNALHGLR